MTKAIVARFVAVLAVLLETDAFSPSLTAPAGVRRTVPAHGSVSRSTTTTTAVRMSGTTVAGDFIGTELRGAAMKLHTREQAPKEGQAQAPQREPYTPTREDYLAFLVDNQHVYQAFEDVVNTNDDLRVFRNTGLERVQPLENDINFLTTEYGLSRPQVGEPGRNYAKLVREMGEQNKVPEFICHFYNHYFAHTAGGRMIGKKMSSLLLDKKTLDFYKWDGDLNEIKGRVKQNIENMVATWNREQKDACVNETAAAFQGGGMLNSYLSGGQSPH